MGELEDELCEWIKENNLPEPSIPKERKKYIREYRVGSKIAEIGSTMKDWKYNVEHIYKSIDCVCIINDRAWILEFKKEPNFEAIGQVLIYKALFEMENPEFKEIKMGIVSEEGHPLNEIASHILGLKITFFKRSQISNWDDFIQRVTKWYKFNHISIEEMIKRYKEEAK